MMLARFMVIAICLVRVDANLPHAIAASLQSLAIQLVIVWQQLPDRIGKAIALNQRDDRIGRRQSGAQLVHARDQGGARGGRHGGTRGACTSTQLSQKIKNKESSM
jgi:hypothetical protein